MKLPALADTVVSNKGRYYGAGLLHLDGFEPYRLMQKRSIPRGMLLFGAGGRARTGTVSPPVDFESTTSTNSITRALPDHCIAGKIEIQ